MNNFKSGSGDLDFGDEADSDESEDTSEQSTPSSGETPVGSLEDENPNSDSQPPVSDQNTARETTPKSSDGVSVSRSTDDYPYFVRRSNVMDERDVRLEVHVRDRVTSQEASFRQELAAELDVDNISKTDAREFALMYAYQHPESVAELLREEGFGLI